MELMEALLVQAQIAISLQNASTSLFKRHTTQTGQNYIFPLGDLSYYTPINLIFNAASLNSNSMMNVKVTNASHPNIGAPIPASYLNRYWTVEPQSISGPLNYNINFVYNDADIVGIEANIKAYKYNRCWMDCSIRKWCAIRNGYR
jgi:hypothetical protein